MDDDPPAPEYRKSKNTAELYSEIRIRATPGRIWGILTDFPLYPEWNPFIRTIEGILIEGAGITAYLRPSGGTGMKIRPVILNIVPERELRWRGHLFVPGLFDGEHVFEIRPTGGGSCLFVQHEYFSGLLLPFFGTTLKNGTARGFDAMNRALKARAEEPGGS